MKDRFLPIGTVVLLNGGTKEVMITSYCIFPTGTQLNKEGKMVEPDKRIYEYGGCLYPEGILDSNSSCAFDHSQIAKILHMGYETENQANLSKILDDNYEDFKVNFEKNMQSETAA